MLNWKQINQRLIDTAKWHPALASKFAEFAKHVETQVTAPTFHIKGIATDLHLEQGFFTTTFAARTVSFVFTSSIDSDHMLMGNVTCYMKKDFPQPEQQSLGGFVFSTRGQTNLTDSEEHDHLYMGVDLGALQMALHFIAESLTK